MTFGEGLFWFYMTLATLCFSAAFGYFAVCGLAQWLHDASIGELYRTKPSHLTASEDDAKIRERFREVFKGVDANFDEIFQGKQQ